MFGLSSFYLVHNLLQREIEIKQDSYGSVSKATKILACKVLHSWEMSRKWGSDVFIDDTTGMLRLGLAIPSGHPIFPHNIRFQYFVAGYLCYKLFTLPHTLPVNILIYPHCTQYFLPCSFHWNLGEEKFEQHSPNRFCEHDHGRCISHDYHQGRVQSRSCVAHVFQAVLSGYEIWIWRWWPNE